MEGIINQCPTTLQGLPAQLFLTLINTLFAAQCDLKPPTVQNYGPILQNGDEFDFIIVGAGSAGSVVANRLSEVPEWKVLLLEAGSDPSITTEIPSLTYNLQGTSEDWQQKTQRQEDSCQGFEDHQCRLGSGKVLGGSSSINGMMYVRGNSRDYDNWEKAGNAGWGWEEVLKYFKKSEDNGQFLNNDRFHSTGGYLKVNKYGYDYPVKNVIRRAAKELGLNRLKDLHNGTNLGYGDAQGTVRKGRRWSTFKAFLVPVQERENFFIAKDAFVHRVTLQGAAVKGVEVEINGQVLKIGARKEVILSAGALKTPQVLMLSGIGPKEALDKLEIPIVKDLPVGMNLQDHLTFLGLFVGFFKHKYFESKNEKPLDEIYNYFIHRKGLHSSIGITNFVGFVDTLGGSAFPDVQFHHVYHKRNDPSILLNFLGAAGVDNSIISQLVDYNKNLPLLQIAPTLLNPNSTGFVTLSSANPKDHPLIHTNYLTTHDDLAALIRSIRFIEKLIETKAFSKYVPKILTPIIPGCTSFDLLSDHHLECLLRHLATTTWHYAGTAKMGPENDGSSVVNPRLKVLGVSNLRVADNSIMPRVVSGNTNAAAVMIGEKAADMIKEDWEGENVDKKDEL